jgi:pterin-4a-carbinolamine dehydratase
MRRCVGWRCRSTTLLKRSSDSTLVKLTLDVWKERLGWEGAGGVLAEACVFVSYRRDSDLLRASLVTNQISHALPEVKVFRDTRMRLGEKWPVALNDALQAADVVLVLIGPGWLGAKDQFERRRIDQPDDWVRLEIETALNKDKIVIPIAFEESLPPAEALPESIVPLLDCQAAIVRDVSVERDLEPVLSAIQQVARGSSGLDLTRGQGGTLPYPEPPMKFPPAPIGEEELELILGEELPQWSMRKGPARGKPELEGVYLHRDLTFKRFRHVMPFMTAVADFADKANHHPQWENIFRTVSIDLTTWDIEHRISSLDLMLASFIDRTYRRYHETEGLDLPAS